MKRRQTRLLDQHGRPVSFNGFFEAGSLGRREQPWGYYNGARDTDQMLDRYTWNNYLSAGRFLFTNVPILRGAILEQANFSFPLSAHYIGPDRDWADIAEEWVYEWQKNCNVRGPLYNAQTVSRLRLIGRKVDGDIGTVLVRSHKGDFPKTQLIRAHRIGDRYGWGGEIKKGPFRGKRSRNGVVHDEWERPIGYCILGEKESEDQWISANDMFLLGRPTYGDESRMVSELCACIRSFADIKRLREYEMRAQQLAASIALLEKNETGMADETAEAFGDESGGEDASGTATGLKTETFEDGLIKYFKARSGSGLEAFRSDRPSADAQSWEDKILAQAFYGIEWDPDFAMCLKQPGGAWVRAKMQKIHRAIANNVQIEAWAQQVEIGFAVGQAIKDGVLPAPKDGNFHAWDVVLGIPLPTADSGNEEAAWREAYKIGWVTLQAVTSRSGGWWTDIRKQRQTEVRDLLTRAQEIRKEFSDLSLQEALWLLEQRGPNAPAQQGSENNHGGAEDTEMTEETERAELSSDEEGQDQEGQEAAPRPARSAMAFQQVKMEMDAYGVAVRAGVITPTMGDEEHFRKKAALPPLSEDAKKVWDKERTRRPITLAQPEQKAAPAKGKNEESEG